jgi:hypothetical protein
MIIEIVKVFVPARTGKTRICKKNMRMHIITNRKYRNKGIARINRILGSPKNYHIDLISITVQKLTEE